MIMKKVNVVFVMTLRSCSHNAKFGLFCKKICQQEAISSVNDFFHPPKFTELLPKFRDAVENMTRCEQGCRNKIFKFFATASANRVEIRIYALISVVPCPILPTRLARISSDTAVFSPQQHCYFCASRRLSQWGKNKRKERDSISFLSFLPCCERPLLAGNIIAEGVIATRSNPMKFRLPLTPHLTWCMYLVL